MAKVGITDTILRDAHQSLVATRMTTEEMLPALHKLDAVGFHSLECCFRASVPGLQSTAVWLSI